MRFFFPPPATPAILASHTTRLSGKSLTLVRSGWLALFLLYIILFVLGMPVAFREATVMSDSTHRELTARGIEPLFLAYYFLGLDTVTFIAFGAVALFIVLRQPDDWIVMLSSLTLIATAMLYSIPGHNAPVPYWIPSFAIALGEIFQVSFVYLFPIGIFIPRWMGLLILPMLLWRPAIWVLNYLPNYLETTRTLENYGTLRQDGLDTGLMLLLFAIGIGAQVYRYRRVYNYTQRLQTKWVLWGMLIAVLVTGTWIILVNAAGLLEDGGANTLLLRMIGRTIRQIALFMVPLTLAFSILRYRLWDIDLLLRRTLIYAPLTAILAGLFAAIIVLSQRVAVALTGSESILAIVAATIVVVAAVEPVKQGIQNIADRRLKDTTDPQGDLARFRVRVEKRLSAVRTGQLLRRFADEAVAAFQAEGGAVYRMENNQLARVYVCGTPPEPPPMIVPVRANGAPIGSIALGWRRDERPYSKQDQAWLEETAAVVGTAIEQDNSSRA
jgi:hypothetical protein